LSEFVFKHNIEYNNTIMLLRSHANVPKCQIYVQEGRWVRLPKKVNKQLVDWRNEAMRTRRSQRFSDPQTMLNGERIAYDVNVNADGAVVFERLYGCETKFFFDPRWDEIADGEVGVSGFYPLDYSI